MAKRKLYLFKNELKSLEDWKKYFNSNISLSTISKRIRNLHKYNFEDCFKLKYILPSKAENFIGHKFGRLKIIEIISDQINNCKCLCDCGKICFISWNKINYGQSTSCGCAKLLKGQESRKYTGYKEISGSHFANIKNGAKRRNIEFNITIEYIWDLYIKQDKKCALSGINISFNSSKNNNLPHGTASLDRINSSKGYIEGNVWWVHKDVNEIKWDFTKEKFLYYIKLIYEFNHLNE